MIVRGAAAPKALDPDQYDEKVIRENKKRRNNITGITKQDKRRKERVDCKICGANMQRVSLKRHMRTIHEGVKENEQQKYICREID